MSAASIVDSSGCYGRNGHEAAAADAALVPRRGRSACNGYARTSAVGTPTGSPTLIGLHGGLDGDQVNPDRVKNQIEGSVVQTTPF